MTGQPGIETRELWFAYEDAQPVLRGLSIQIEGGSFVAIIGQNGSGKTTLVKHFNGLLRPSRGQVRVDGKDIRQETVGTLARTVGYAFQHPDHQIFSPTTREEIAFGPANLGLGDPEVEDITREALSRFGLEDYAGRQPATLSFGLRRKVSLAAVYAMQTPILVLDEPTTGLDDRSTRDVMALVTELHERGRTIILITHDMRIVAEYAPHCLVLRDGQVVAHDETRAVFGQADLLRANHIEPPQIHALGRRMAPHGLRADVMTVAEFCEAYDELRDAG